MLVQQIVSISVSLSSSFIMSKSTLSYISFSAPPFTLAVFSSAVVVFSVETRGKAHGAFFRPTCFCPLCMECICGGNVLRVGALNPTASARLAEHTYSPVPPLVCCPYRVFARYPYSIPSVPYLHYCSRLNHCICRQNACIRETNSQIRARHAVERRINIA